MSDTYEAHVLAKIWSIVKKDSESEYDTNNLYDLVREGAEARRALADAGEPADYPNLRALAQGCMSGNLSEWPRLKAGSKGGAGGTGQAEDTDMSAKEVPDDGTWDVADRISDQIVDIVNIETAFMIGRGRLDGTQLLAGQLLALLSLGQTMPDKKPAELIAVLKAAKVCLKSLLAHKKLPVSQIRESCESET